MLVASTVIFGAPALRRHQALPVRAAETPTGPDSPKGRGERAMTTPGSPVSYNCVYAIE